MSTHLESQIKYGKSMANLMYEKQISIKSLTKQKRKKRGGGERNKARILNISHMYFFEIENAPTFQMCKGARGDLSGLL